MNQESDSAIILPPPLPAFLPEAGDKVRVVEIAPWDELPDHSIGEIVVVGPDCWRANGTCDEREDGDWLLLHELGASFKATLCRVELCES